MDRLHMRLVPGSALRTTRIVIGPPATAGLDARRQYMHPGIQTQGLTWRRMPGYPLSTVLEFDLNVVLWLLELACSRLSSTVAPASRPLQFRILALFQFKLPQ